jgi:Na+/phosphate symporter
MEYTGFVFSSMTPQMFTFSEIAAWFFTTSGILTFFVLLGFSGLVIYQKRNRFIKKNQLPESEENVSENDGVEEILKKCRNQLTHFLDKTTSIYTSGIESFLNEDLTGLKNILAEKEDITIKLEKSKENIFSIAARLESSLHSGHYLVDLKDYQVRIINSLSLLLEPLIEHLSNSHKPFINAQAEELRKLENEIANFLSLTAEIVNKQLTNENEKPELVQKNLYDLLNSMAVAQIKRIKSSQVNTRNSILFLNIISETKNILNHTTGLFHSYFHLTPDLKIENPNKTETVIQL